MRISIARPELLTLTDRTTGRSYFGGAQDWYPFEWGRKAGCGPTCAANLTAYLAMTRPVLRTLYAEETLDCGSFVRHMQAVYAYITPGPMGVNRVQMLAEGTCAFAKSRGVRLRAQVFGVDRRPERRPAPVELAAFVRRGLASDCPVGFLNLSRGQAENLQNWHWIAITAADLDDDRLMADASDEGEHRRFDLLLWYRSTRMSGGLVYFTA